MNLCLRPAVEADAERVYSWRNHPLVRRASLDTREIPWEEHLAWFRRALESAERRLLIAEQDESPVGVLRFDVKEEQAEISIYLDPGRTGQGLGTAMLRAGVEWARGKLQGVKVLSARIRPDNPGSLKAFEKAGFSESWRVYDMNL